MKIGKKSMISVFLIGILLLSSGCKPWTIVKNEGSNDDGSIQIYFESDDFDADTVAREIWDNDLGAYFQESQVDAKTLLEGLKADEAGTGEQYGIGDNDEGSKWQFVIEGKAKVLEVDKESRAGIMLVDLEPYDGQSDLTVQIGPVIKGTSIRDALAFLKLDDFANQVEFASVSKAFNGLVVEEVIGDQDFGQYIDEEINFIGCFTYSDVDEILVTPVSLSGLESE